MNDIGGRGHDDGECEDDEEMTKVVIEERDEEEEEGGGRLEKEKEDDDDGLLNFSIVEQRRIWGSEWLVVAVCMV